MFNQKLKTVLFEHLGSEDKMLIEELDLTKQWLVSCSTSNSFSVNLWHGGRWHAFFKDYFLIIQLHAHKTKRLQTFSENVSMSQNQAPGFAGNWIKMGLGETWWLPFSQGFETDRQGLLLWVWCASVFFPGHQVAKHPPVEHQQDPQDIGQHAFRGKQGVGGPGKEERIRTLEAALHGLGAANCYRNVERYVLG